MTTFLQAAGGVLLAVILTLTLKQQGKDFALLLSVTVCCSLAALSVYYLQPVFQFVLQLQQLGNLNAQMLQILLKVVGIALVSEIAAMVCADSGNGAMGKGLQYLALAIILRLSLPMLSALMNIVEGISENL